MIQRTLCLLEEKKIKNELLEIYSMTNVKHRNKHESENCAPMGSSFSDGSAKFDRCISKLIACNAIQIEYPY